MPSPTQDLGAWGERIAAEFLAQRGFTILDRHFTSRFGEIDIIAQEKGQMVFVEVKTRLKRVLGEPEQAIDRKKQKRLKKTIFHYVSLREVSDFRIDAITILPGKTQKTVQIRHHRALFDALDF